METQRKKVVRVRKGARNRLLPSSNESQLLAARQNKTKRKTKTGRADERILKHHHHRSASEHQEKTDGQTVSQGQIEDRIFLRGH